MDSPIEHKDSRTPLAAQVGLCVVGIVILPALMYYSITYPYPSGKPPDLASLVAFWLREILILAFAAICLLVGIAGWLVQLFRRVRVRGKDAL